MLHFDRLMGYTLLSGKVAVHSNHFQLHPSPSKPSEILMDKLGILCELQFCLHEITLPPPQKKTELRPSHGELRHSVCISGLEIKSPSPAPHQNSDLLMERTLRRLPLHTWALPSRLTSWFIVSDRPPEGVPSAFKNVSSSSALSKKIDINTKVILYRTTNVSFLCNNFQKAKLIIYTTTKSFRKPL